MFVTNRFLTNMFVEAGRPGWYRGYSDPVVGEALRQIDHAPQQYRAAARSPS
jgi:hypothetical protein